MSAGRSAAAALALLALAAGPARAQGPLDRPADPVVLSGAEAGPLRGAPPEAVGAFRFEAGRWVPIPVQVDERRAGVDLGDAYGPAADDPARCARPARCANLRGQVDTLTFWTDPQTYLGGDPDPSLDDDDEVVFMARDAGARAPAAAARPAGTVGLGAEVAVRAADGPTGYVYLFRRDGTRPPPPGYVAYAPRFCDPSGADCAPGAPYRTTYRIGGVAGDGGPRGTAPGANPEATTFTSAHYRLHFADRWILDGLVLRDGAAPEADLLDRHKVLTEPGACARHETSASLGQGAFLVDRAGPVRALRAVIGFNSGPLTTRTYVLYDRMMEVRTDLRVHAIPGALDLFDYSRAAEGMRYRASWRPEAPGALVDGRPDGALPADRPLAWEVLQGPPGTLVIATELDTDLPLTVEGVYLDDAAPPVAQCTGDGEAIGTSGAWVGRAAGLPDTDPRPSGAAVPRLALRRRVVVGGPELQPDAVLARLEQPLAASVAAWEPGVGPLAPPEGDRLGMPFPNPAAETLTVPFELAARGRVTVALVDALGRRVGRGVDETRPPGPGTAHLDARGVAAGAYTVRLTTAAGAQTRRVVILGRP